MALQFKSHIIKQASPRFDRGFKIMQVHKFNPIG